MPAAQCCSRRSGEQRHEVTLRSLHGAALGWKEVPAQPHPLSHRRARCQDVLKADVLSQCQDTAEGECQHLPPPWHAVLGPTPSHSHAGMVAVERPVFGVEKNSTFLECRARSPQTAVRWLARRGEGPGLSEV